MHYFKVFALTSNFFGLHYLPPGIVKLRHMREGKKRVAENISWFDSPMGIQVQHFFQKIHKYGPKIQTWCEAFQYTEKRPFLPKISHTYCRMMKLGIVIPYLKKIQKLYESQDTPSEFCWHQYFFTGNQQILLHQETQI